MIYPYRMFKSYLIKGDFSLTTSRYPMDIANLAKHIHPPPHSVSVAFQIRPFTVRQSEVWGRCGGGGLPSVLAFRKRARFVSFHSAVEHGCDFSHAVNLFTGGRSARGAFSSSPYS